jgi:ubiquinone/menaquinone biosynthesis C-methylase UbiE
VFDDVAELYDRLRPTYPEKLFDTLVQTTGINASSRLLEIAPGTGQATLSLARRSLHITAVELGQKMAAIATKNLREFDRVRVIHAAFEDVDLPDEYFHVVYVATALHWIRPDTQFSKPHRVLTPGGYFAIIAAGHVSHGDDRFFEATQPLYDKFLPPAPGSPPASLKGLEEVAPAELDEQLFQLVLHQCFPRTITYNGEDYCALLSTESDKLALHPNERAAFLKGMATVIDGRFGGVVTRRYANSLTIARKVS